MGEQSSNESADAAGCPVWCVRRHTSRDHPEDRVHQSCALHTTLVTGRPWVDQGASGAVGVVARLVRQPGDTLTWLDVAGEEDPAIRFTITAESGRRLVLALQQLLGAET